MNKRFITLVLSLIMLVMFCLIPKASYAAYADDANIYPALYTSHVPVGVIYGPPLPQNIPAVLASRGGELFANKSQIQKPNTLTYKVQNGDSLYDIASVFNTSVAALAQMNNIADTNLLHVGQELKVPDVNASISSQYEIEQVMNADLTAYTSGPESTGKSPGDPGYGITATGDQVRDQYTVAVDPSVIPLGSKVYIEGVGIRVADDTGGAIQGNRIDVYMSDLNAAIQFGYKKNVKVYVLKDKPQTDNSNGTNSPYGSNA